MKKLKLTVILVCVFATAAVVYPKTASPIQGGDGWRTYNGQYFSFQYPSTLKCCLTEDTATRVAAYAYEEEGRVPFLGIEFRPGFKNKPSVLVQCAGVDDLLRSEAAKLDRKAQEFNRSVRDEFSKHSATFE